VPQGSFARAGLRGKLQGEPPDKHAAMRWRMMGGDKQMARMEVVGWIRRRRNPPLFVGAGYAERMRFAHLQG
jgi:hypothetical protein